MIQLSKSLMPSILTDAEKAVVQTMTMKLLPTPAVQYLNDIMSW
jgi:hypothetical protein